MKQKILLKTMLLLCALVAGTSMSWATEEVFYTLTPANGSNNSYTGNCDVEIDGITWNITGNSQMQPWRLGGKSLSGVDREVYSKTAMGAAITKVKLTVGDASSITVNSLKLIVASDAAFNTVIDQVTETFEANSTITFNPTSGTEWASGAYYKFVFNVSVSGTSNKFVQFTSAGFYKAAAAAKTITDLAYTGTPTKTSYFDGESFDPTGLTVTATFDDSSSENVTTSVVWTPSPLTTGTTSVTGTYMGETITVNGLTVTAAPGSAENPYTCAEAIAAQVAAGANVNDKYVKGIVTKISGSNYWISDDGVVGNEQFECYKGKQDDGTTDIDNTYLNVGDVVVAHGNITKYSSTYELASGNQVYSKTRPVVTVTSNNDSYGTATLSTRTVTAEPASGYRFASPKYTVTTGSATVVDNGDNTFSLSNIWADCAIQFNFEAIPVLNNNSILYVADTYDLDIGDVGGQINLAGATANHGTLQSEIVTASTTVDASKYTWVGNILTVSEGGNGTIVIRFWVDEDEEYYGVEQITTVTVKADPVIAYEDATEETPYGTPYTIDTDLIKGGDITLLSSNTNVATVDGLTITPVAVGTTTITINTDAATFWNAGTATFTLNVTAPTGSETAPSGEVKTTFTNKNLDYEDGGLDWTATIEANSFESSSPARGVQFGAAKGVFTLTHTNTNKVKKVSFVMSTNGTGNTIAVQVGATDFENNDDTSVTLTSGMQNETLEFTGEASGDIVVSCVDANKSIYFKSITVEFEPSVSVELNTSGYATYCSVDPMDFSSTTGYTAWRVSNIAADGTITFTKIEEAIKGGQGVLLYNKDAGGVKTNVTVSFADGTTEFDNGTDANDENDNLLVGTTAPKYLRQVVGDYTNFGLAGNEFKKAADGVTIPANKAYLPVLTSTVNNLISGGVKAFTFVFDDEATGIRTIEKVSVEEAAEIFDLSGRRLNKIQKGINIVNGKKILY